ncbi:MAG: hypothetical protein J7K36_04810 [Archaeoglobaceae archaeon]|nr:hypothetical protein [Archaeoglobaceae archaeon]
MQVPPRFEINAAQKFEPKESEIEERISLANELLSLSKEDYKEVMESKLKELFKNIPTFKKIAEKMIETKDKLHVCPIIARVNDIYMHFSAFLSDNLKALPVYVFHEDYIPETGLFIFNLLLPATTEMDINDLNKIAIEHKKIIEKAIDEVDKTYKKCILKIELDKRTPAPFIRIYNRDGCWTCWKVYMKKHREFWTTKICELPFAKKIPFIATNVYEFVTLMSDEINKNQMKRVKDELIKRAKENHSIEFSNETDIEISYSWFIDRGMLHELKKIDENTLSRALSDKISTNGHKAV